jgi:hypothetical protein
VVEVFSEDFMGKIFWFLHMVKRTPYLLLRGTKYLRIEILITYFLENQNRDSKVAYDVTISVL